MFYCYYYIIISYIYLISLICLIIWLITYVIFKTLLDDYFNNILDR